MTKPKNFRKVNAIMEEASKLPLEEQEVLLAVIRGMQVTRRSLTKSRRRFPRPPQRKEYR